MNPSSETFERMIRDVLRGAKALAERQPLPILLSGHRALQDPFALEDDTVLRGDAPLAFEQRLTLRHRPMLAVVDAADRPVHPEEMCAARKVS